MQMSSVRLNPIEYFNRRLLTQSKKAWVPPPESVRICLCR